MALAKPSLFAAISGVLGGSEFAHTQGSTVIRRRKPRKSQPRTAERNARLFHAYKWHLWRSLTPAQRLAWAVTARENPVPDRFGVSRRLTPPQTFFRCILNIDRARIPQFLDAPRYGTIQAPFSVVFDFKHLTYAWINIIFQVSLPSSTIWLLQVHPPVPPSHSEPSTGWLFLGDVPPDEELTFFSPGLIERRRNYYTAISAALPNAQPGDLIPIRLKFLSPDWFPSAWYSYTATVKA